MDHLLELKSALYFIEKGNIEQARLYLEAQILYHETRREEENKIKRIQ